MRVSRRVRIGLKIAAACACVVLLARAFSGVDWRATWHALASAGPAAILALAPFGVVLVLDSTGVMLIARSAGISLRAVSTLRVRVVSEALHYGAPGGVVASEAAALGMFVRTCGLEMKDAIAIAARRKQFVTRAHAAYIAIGALASAAAFRSLAWLVLASALIPLGMSIGIGFAMKRAKPSAQISVAGTLVFLASWLVESVETAVIASLVGAPLSMTSVLAIESVISLARSAVAFVPGGLGVQDVGYASLLGALGVPHENAAAFVLLKRAKELAWIAIGVTVSWSDQAWSRLLMRSRRNDDRVDRRDVAAGGVRV